MGSTPGLPRSSPELDPDETIRFRFEARRTRDRVGGAGDGDRGNGGEPRSSLSTNSSRGFLGAFGFDLAVAVDLTGRVDSGFTADLRVDLGFGSGSGVVTCVCGPGLDLGEIIRFAGEGSEPKPRSPSEGASRVFPPPRLEFCGSPGSGGLSFEALVLGLPFFGRV